MFMAPLASPRSYIRPRLVSLARLLEASRKKSPSQHIQHSACIHPMLAIGSCLAIASDEAACSSKATRPLRRRWMPVAALRDPASTICMCCIQQKLPLVVAKNPLSVVQKMPHHHGSPFSTPTFACSASTIAVVAKMSPLAKKSRCASNILHC